METGTEVQRHGVNLTCNMNYTYSMDNYVNSTSANCSNNYSSVTSQNNFKQEPGYIFVYASIINTLIFIVGVTGNTLVILAVLCIRKMRNPTNYFLFTLSIADLLVLLVCQPVALMEFYLKERWYIGPVMCKLVPLLENGMLHVSVLTMVAMTTERFYAIIYPFKKRTSCSNSLTLKVIVALWVFAYSCTSPFLLITKLEEAVFYDGTAIKVCRTLIYLPWHKVFVIVNTVAFFVLPLFVLVYMYSQIIRQLMSDNILVMTNNDKKSKLRHRSRKQVVRMLIFIIVLFFVSMCPIRVVSLWYIYTPVEDVENLGIEAYYNIIWFARIMMYINSAGNPVIYCLTSSKFKSAFQRVLQRCTFCKTDDQVRRSSKTTQVFFRPSRRQNLLEPDINHCRATSSPIEQTTRQHEAIVIHIKYGPVSSN